MSTPSVCQASDIPTLIGHGRDDDDDVAGAGAEAAAGVRAAAEGEEGQRRDEL